MGEKSRFESLSLRQRLDGNGQFKKRAAYLNFHGGGWVFGGLQIDHDFCKRVVDALDGNLFAFDVDYIGWLRKINIQFRWMIVGRFLTG